MRIALLFTLLLLSCSAAHADALLRPNDVVALGGDSTIAQPLVEQYLLMCQPVRVRAMEFADGDTRAGDFLRQLPVMVNPFHPTVMTVSPGMSDGGFIALPPTSDQATDFRRGEAGIIEALKRDGVREIILTSPPCIDPALFNRPTVTAEKYAQTLRLLADINQKIASEQGVRYVDLNDEMAGVLRKARARYGRGIPFMQEDGMHPLANAQLVYAWVILRALGCDGNIGTITVDYAGKQATGSPGHEILSYQDGEVIVKSSRYPFCFIGSIDDMTSGGANAAITTVFPFNDDLNRYMLVVKGLPGQKATITWGGQAKDFATGDLARGINLAADFYNNPFQPAALKVANAVYVQQNHENFFVNAFLGQIPNWLEGPLGPGAAKGLQDVSDSGVAHHATLWKQASDSVQPVQHTIKITPEH